jgi:L,D-transpeptidase ErfK/SrfK
MYPENIEELFNMVPIGTPVRIINEPYKVGTENGKLFLEAHIPLQEEQIADAGNLSPLINAVSTTAGTKPADIHWDKAIGLAKEPPGVPLQIGEVG